MADISVQGADKMLALSKHLKATAPELRKVLNKELRQDAKPLIGKTRKAFRRGLPQRGGVNEVFAKRPMRVKVATGSKPGVSIVAAKTDKRIDQGRLAHPTFGRKPIVVQRVKAGLFSDTLKGEAPEIRVKLVKTVDTFLDRLGG